ncbi:hypothetical protein [Roseivirga pacifica]|uniref:hypothetical protein n=2 Tax=Roseivirga pacifica TaxID=1267423 RepID=UPI00209508AF|nr:hypothetical protein [Roseivirga pacifica]MCO6370372.1 hypothetical protein [Roseivirga pacifica]
MLKKGFLRNNYRFEKTEVAVLIAYWFTFSIALYLILAYLTEGMPLVMKDLYFSKKITPIKGFNFFIAATSVCTGLSFSIQLFLRQQLTRKAGSKRSLITKTISTQVAFTSWLNLAVISRFLSVVAIFFFAINFEFEKIDDFGLVLFLMYATPAVFFLNTWLHFYKLFGKFYFRNLGLSLAISGLFIVVLISIKPISHNRLNKFIQKVSIIENYDFKLPTIESGYYFRNRYSKKYIIAQGSDTFFTIFNARYGKPQKLDWDNFKEEIKNTTHPRIFNLLVDQDLKLKDFNIIRSTIWAISDAYVINIHANSVENDHYNKLNSYMGTSYYRPFDCKEADEFISNLRNKGVNPKRVIWPKNHPCYFIADVMHKNRIIVTADRKKIWLNNQVVTPYQLQEVIYNYKSKNKQNSYIFLKISDDVSLERYLQINDLITQPTIWLREQLSEKPYDYFDYQHRHNIMYPVEDEYPFNIIELTGIGLNLYEYLTKSNSED